MNGNIDHIKTSANLGESQILNPANHTLAGSGRGAILCGDALMPRKQESKATITIPCYNTWVNRNFQTR